MIKKIICYVIVTFITLLNVIPTFGQRSKPILSKEQNQIWFDSLVLLTTNKQLDLIRERILTDTLVYNKNQWTMDRFHAAIEREQILKSFGFIADGRVLYCLKFQNSICTKRGKFRIFQWDNWTEAQYIIGFHDFLTSEKIKDIEILKDEAKEKAIYGTRTGFGIVTFNLGKKKFIREYDRTLTVKKPKT
jgi:hypothetical protein